MNERQRAKFAPGDLADGLPAPGGDEPAMLRQDIADEIADHLHCAALREHLQNSVSAPLTDQAALAAAVERFGEPAAVARRLWWDAMKERIMAQRILTGMAIAATAASVLACGLVWQSMRSQRETMAAVLAELKATQQSDGAQWQTLRFRLVDEDGKAAGGVVECASSDQSLKDQITADASGMAEFYLPPGQYATTIRCGGMHTQLSLLLPPRSVERKIVCPAIEPKRAPVAFRVDLSGDGLGVNEEVGRDAALHFVAVITFLTRKIGDHSWNQPGDGQTGQSRVYLLIDRQGRVLGRLTSPEVVVPTAYEVHDTFPATVGPDPALQPAEPLPPGRYLVNVAAYVKDVKKIEAGQPDAPSETPVAKGIPLLKAWSYEPGFPRHVSGYVIDTDQPGSNEVPITGKFFVDAFHEYEQVKASERQALPYNYVPPPVMAP